MRSKILHSAVAAMVVALLIAWPGATQRAMAQAEHIIHTFSGPDGIDPIAGVTFDSAGNLYGVASGGGSSNSGTVYELIPGSNGTWTEKTLLSFDGSVGGSTPVGGLVFDSKGNLYGTTKLGGHFGVGLVYELTPSNSGTWTEIVLHNFGNFAADGAYPVGNLGIDASGDVFGTTQGGGVYGNGTETQGGTVFELSHGVWTESILHSFGSGNDGNFPRGGVTLDASGNVFGTTSQGGLQKFGTAFELSPNAGGWTYAVIHSFNPFHEDPWYPVTGLTFDSAGRLFGGTTNGSLYRLEPQSGMWKLTTMAVFSFDENTESLYSNVVLNSAGHIFGMTWEFNGGRLFESTGSAGSWKWVLSFTGTKNGARPAMGTMAMDSAGNLYGATQAGGPNNEGIVFKITQ